jgi:hypothetical protein
MAEPFVIQDLSDSELNQLAEEMASNYERMWEAKDSDVIAAMVECGCTQIAAVEQLKHEGLAVYARQFYLDWQDAMLGNAVAKARVERCKAMWGNLRQRGV